MITGSHNPSSDNGLKMTVNGKSFFGEDIIRLYDEVVNISSELDIITNDKVNIIDKDYSAEYIEFLLSNLKIDENLKIVWDSGNGVAGNILENLIDRLPNQNILLNNEIDGNFPARGPDPTKASSLKQLSQMVMDRGFDIGIAFDGDGDRMVVVISSGMIVASDQLICFFAQHMLQYRPGSNFIMDVKSSKYAFDFIRSLGGNAIMSKTGHSFVKQKMHETGAEAAAELSGHYYFREIGGYDDAIYAALQLVELLSKYDLNSFIEQWPKTLSTTEIKININESKVGYDKFQIIEKIKEFLIKDGVEFNAASSSLI